MWVLLQKGVCTLKDLIYLRREVLKYEEDPNHTITQKHIQLRMRCVIEYGAEAVQQVVSSVCAELLERRRLCLSAEFANVPYQPKPLTVKGFSSGLAKPVKSKKTKTTSRMGHRGHSLRR